MKLIGHKNNKDKLVLKNARRTTILQLGFALVVFVSSSFRLVSPPLFYFIFFIFFLFFILSFFSFPYSFSLKKRKSFQQSEPRQPTLYSMRQQRRSINKAGEAG